MGLYYESHITIDPVFDARRDMAAQIASQFGFRLAKLIMRKHEADEEQPSQDDTFMTGHSQDMMDIAMRTRNCVQRLNLEGFVVRRYKIEDTVVDSRTNDIYRILVKEPADVKEQKQSRHRS